jgi:hypothetical protein
MVLVPRRTLHASRRCVALLTGSVYLGTAEFFVHWIIDDSKCAGHLDYDWDQIHHLGCKIVWTVLAVGAGLRSPLFNF